MTTGRQYRLIRELGTGTFGTVYQAELQTVGDFRKAVALKVLHPTWERNADAAGRFRDEARLLGQLRHRHIVKVDGLIRVGGRWAVVMEYVEGVDGNLIVKACRKMQQPYPIPAALEVAAAVASALEAAFHFQPEGMEPLAVIHRDIKPSNIRLTADGDVKVLDFGIAQADFEGREITTDSVRYGSIRYMSPERRSTTQDTASGDVYALGCVLFEFLVGRPFGNAELEAAAHTEKVRKSMRRVRQRAARDAEPIVTLVERMLAFEPRDRPLADEVNEECRRLARATPGQDQFSFARRFVPKVYQVIGDTSVPVDRTVGSTGASSDAEVILEGRTSPVLREETIVPPPRRQREGPPPKPALPLYHVTTPVVAAAIVVGISFTLQLSGHLETQNSAFLATQRVMAASAATHSAPLPALPALPPPVDTADDAGASTVAPDEPAPAPAAAPRPAPQPRPEPAPVAAPEPPPVTPAPSGGTGDAPASEPSSSAPATPVPTTVAPAPRPPEDVAPTGETLRAVKFTLAGAEAIRADCAGASASGTTSALVREPRVGACTVTATVAGVPYATVVTVDAAAGLTCTVEASELTCR